MQFLMYNLALSSIAIIHCTAFRALSLLTIIRIASNFPQRMYVLFLVLSIFFDRVLR